MNIIHVNKGELVMYEKSDAPKCEEFEMNYLKYCFELTEFSTIK